MGTDADRDIAAVGEPTAVDTVTEQADHPVMAMDPGLQVAPRFIRRSRVGRLVIGLFWNQLKVVRLDGPNLGAALAWAGATVVFATVWTGVAVGVSAAVSSRYRSLAGLVATYLLFSRGVGLWDPVVRPAIAFVGTGRFSAEEFVTAADSPAWFRYADHLNPFVAFSTVRDGLLEATGYGTQYTELVVPLFLYSVGILVLFAIVPIGIGIGQFERTDF